MVEIYFDFLKSLGINHNSDLRNIYFEDAPAVLYIKDYILGFQNKQTSKYLIIDEMQDYNLIHYDIFNKLFDCNKLVLGDINQNVFEIYNEKDLVNVCNQIGDCDLMKLDKSYRSTYEISKFCQELKNINYNVVDRHGKEVEIIKLKDEVKESEKISKIFNESVKGKVALICKTQKEAESYYNRLKKRLMDYL
jgi:DNA helicase-2/ATP-dependent DNA helicase PcrA